MNQDPIRSVGMTIESKYEVLNFKTLQESVLPEPTV